MLEKTAGKLEVSIVKKACKGRKECSRLVESVVSHALGRPLMCKNKECIYAGGDECSIYLEEAKKFSIVTGIASRPREPKEPTGDSHSFMELRGKVHACHQ